MLQRCRRTHESQNMYEVSFHRISVILVDSAPLCAQQIGQLSQRLICLHQGCQPCETWRDDRPDSINASDQVPADFLHADVGNLWGFGLLASRDAKLDVLVFKGQHVSLCPIQLAEPVHLVPAFLNFS